MLSVNPIFTKCYHLKNISNLIASHAVQNPQTPIQKIRKVAAEISVYMIRWPLSVRRPRCLLMIENPPLTLRQPPSTSVKPAVTYGSVLIR